jgi:murein DD-endopeptidase MepM/ murein hydrolase activator NlpD
MSRLPATPKVSSHAGDPIAALELEEERKAPPQVAVRAFIMPFAKGRVRLFNQGRRHPAIDLAGALGSSVLATTMRQTVVFAGWRGGYGNAVITRDPSGRLHLYGHLRGIASSVGQILDQGMKLGHLGSTGRSTGPHVHYEVRDPKGRHINPVTLLFPGRAVSNGFAWADVRLAPRPTRVASNQPRPR